MKQNELVDVATGDGVVCLARIVKVGSNMTDVQFLSPVRRNTFSFEDGIESVPNETIIGFYDTENIEDTKMYKMINTNVFEGVDYESESDSDADFEPDEYDSEDDDDISLVDEDETDEEDEE